MTEKPRNKPTCLITGSAGHLGRALVAGFTDAGYTVHGIDKHDVDLEDRAAVADFVKYAAHYDVVINNAKVEDWHHIVGLGTLATRAVINIGSIYGVVGSDPAMYVGTEVEPTPASYVAAKGSMAALTRHQATTLAPVRANCVILGGIYRNHSPEFVARYTKKVPLGRMATEADAVNAALWLASDKSSYITGAAIPVEGGMLCQA